MRSRRRWKASTAAPLRVAEKQDGKWHVHQWLKKAVLLSFRLNDSERDPRRPRDPGNRGAGWFDKVPSKFAGWDAGPLRRGRLPRRAGLRRAPLAYIAPGVVLMPSFVNVGAYVDSGTMVDTWATVGSCAQIGKNCHISGGVGIGGVLEPLQAEPGDHRGQLLHRRPLRGGRRRDRREGAVLSMGVFIGASTKIDRPRDRRGLYRPRAGLFRGGPGHAAGQAAAGRRARPVASTAPSS